MSKGPYAGHIIVKGGDGRKAADRRTYRSFYSPVDKGSAKPAFCYPGRVDALKEEVNSMERQLQNIPGDRKLQFEADLKKRKVRLDQIEEGREQAMKEYDANKQQWDERYEDIKQMIRSETPSRRDVKERRVNPHTVMKKEKEGFGELKKEYQILSKIKEEESNITYLQR